MTSKRRSGHAGLTEDFTATPDPKRRKRNDDTHFPEVESAQTTTDLGLKLVSQLKRSQDKNGRNVAHHFIDLPSRVDYPDYYQQTPMPLSLNMIEQRLQDFQYQNMEELEADLKRMVQNAKDYNSNKSSIFEDAERIRKALSNYMPKHNPAYLRPDYRAYPTPIPQELLNQRRESSADNSDAVLVQPEKIKIHLKRRRSEATPSTLGNVADEDPKPAMLEFLDLLSSQEDAINFEQKPSKRDYRDYYKVITEPIAIEDIRDQVENGAINDWNVLASKVRLIWTNAREYNTEESDIYRMADDLEQWSEKEMQRRGVAPVPRTNLKLSVSQPSRPKALRLTMGSQTPTPTVAGGTIDNESLRRQKEEMGQALSRAQRASSRTRQANGSTPGPLSATASFRRSISEITDQQDTIVADTNGTGVPSSEATVKVSQTPAPVHLPTSVVETDPANPGNPPLTNGNVHHDQSKSLTTRESLQSENPLERRYRDPGKDILTALIRSVIFQTNPNQASDPRWKLVRYASPDKTQTSGLISLPSSYSMIRVIPNLNVIELSQRRRHKVFVTHNGTLYREPNSSQRGAYDINLYPGENLINVEVLADLRQGEKKAYAPPQLQFDFEKCGMIINLGGIPG
ncbi:hypothetical protein B0A52_09247 [Exophiala mesophila]|uniref:Bromo domain-containing protein n=1 Tax=Exophiala mesophila TaxID=212818 RepID=A0A438MTN8_EXOME|nr:hypothetical protein B0A52_09247 [Exophiala mesophila]